MAEVTTIEVPINTESKAPESSEATVTRPEGLPENFKSVDDLAKAHKDTQAELTRLTQGNNQDAEVKEQSSENPQETPNIPDSPQEEAKEALETKGLDLGSFSQEFADNGTLSEDSYKLLENAGIPKSTVDQYITGQQAVQEKSLNTLYDTAGGKDNLDSMLNWASSNLSETEIQAFNEVVSSSSQEQALLAVSGLRGRYEASEGKSPNIQNGDTGSSSRHSGDTFSTAQEMSLAGRKKDSDGRLLRDVDLKYRNWYFETIANSNI
jgi:hypothetical protein